MKKFIAITLLAALLSGCAQDNQFGATYGYANQDSKKNPKATYEWSVGSVLIAIIFSETLVIPAYIVGWNLFEATGVKK